MKRTARCHSYKRCEQCRCSARRNGRRSPIIRRFMSRPFRDSARRRQRGKGDVFPISDEERAKALNHEGAASSPYRIETGSLGKGEGRGKADKQASPKPQRASPAVERYASCHVNRVARAAQIAETLRSKPVRKFLTESHPLSTWNCSRAASAPSSVILSSTKNCTPLTIIPRQSRTHFVAYSTSARNASKSGVILASMRSSPKCASIDARGSGSVASPDRQARDFPCVHLSRGVALKGKRPHLRRWRCGRLEFPFGTKAILPNPAGQRVRR